jgi:hypothetical protein
VRLSSARRARSQAVCDNRRNQGGNAVSSIRDAEDRARFAEQMVGIVSHDLRNHLTAIKMGMRMHTSSALAPGKRDQLAEHIDGSVD